MQHENPLDLLRREAEALLGLSAAASAHATGNLATTASLDRRFDSGDASREENTGEHLAPAHDREHLIRVLRDLLEIAPHGCEEAYFAHRHLAELLVEEEPWQAALHLRRMIALRDDDSSAHALMGLCLAILGNYDAAIASYLRAIRCNPQNAWYLHNLGHLLHVALESPARGVSYLKRAHDLAPLEPEITASLAHCYATLGRKAEGLSLAQDVLAAQPHNQEYRDLVEWIEAKPGASSNTSVSTSGSSTEEHAGSTRPMIDSAAEGPVDRVRVIRRSTVVPNTDHPKPTTVSKRDSIEHPTQATLALIAERMPARLSPEELLSVRMDVERFFSTCDTACDAPSVAATVAYFLFRTRGTPRTQAELASSYNIPLSRLRARVSEFRRRHILQLN